MMYVAKSGKYERSIKKLATVRAETIEICLFDRATLNFVVGRIRGADR